MTIFFAIQEVMSIWEIKYFFVVKSHYPGNEVGPSMANISETGLVRAL